MVVSLQKFTVNGVLQNFLDCKGFAGEGILNGGDVLDNELEFTFKITQAEVKSITYRIILFDEYGGYMTSNKLTFINTVNKTNTSLTKELIGFEEIKNINSIDFNVNDKADTFTLNITSTSNNSCFIGLEGIILHLLSNDVWITFSGPLTDRSFSKILCTAIDVKSNTLFVTASKNPVQTFNKELDNVDGRIYFKKDGIFVDGYQYAVNTEATDKKAGISKLQLTLLTDDGGIQVPNELGVSASPLFVLDVLKNTTGLIDAELLSSASTELYGFTKLQDNFEIIIDEETEQEAILPPEGTGIAASPQLVYNALASAINYTDEKIAPIQEILDGIEAPLIINIENDEEEIESLGEELTFSNDFELKDKKLYIKWLEIS